MLNAHAPVIDPCIPKNHRAKLIEDLQDRDISFKSPAPPKHAPPRPLSGAAITCGMAAICVVLLSAVAALGHWLGAMALHHSAPLQRYTGVGDVVLYVLLGLTGVALLTTLGSAIIASSTGWRRIVDPAWHDPVSAYYGHYVIPYSDMDEKARSVWVRVVNAHRRMRQSRVVARHLIDSIRVSVILPQHMWEIARRSSRAFLPTCLERRHPQGSRHRG